MFCKCDNPKKKIVRIEHKDVNVCAKSIGGCGCEIVNTITTNSIVSIANIPYRVESGTLCMSCWNSKEIWDSTIGSIVPCPDCK